MGFALLWVMIPHCPRCASHATPSSDSRKLIRFGFFRRRSDGRIVQRYRCLICKHTLSQATPHPCYRQKKRHHNHSLMKLLCSGVSQRRSARFLKISRTTVARKLVFLASEAELKFDRDNSALPQAEAVQFDDLETSEHTKCKPLSVILMVEEQTRRILGFAVAQMPAKGRLAAISRKKYGRRADHRPQARQRLFAQTKPLISPKATIKFDKSPHYPKDIEQAYPSCTFKTFKGRKSSVAGQGELKTGGYDPIFSINHTFAMLRANINRLFRRTWCTTKRPDRLRAHIMLYAHYHNSVLI